MVGSAGKVDMRLNCLSELDLDTSSMGDEVLCLLAWEPRLKCLPLMALAFAPWVAGEGFQDRVTSEKVRIEVCTEIRMPGDGNTRGSWFLHGVSCRKNLSYVYRQRVCV